MASGVRAASSLSLGVVTNAPSPHFNPLLNGLADMGIEVHVVFMGERNRERNWVAQPLHVASVQSLRHGAFAQTRPFVGAVRQVRRQFKFADVVLLAGSYAALPFLGAVVGVRTLGVPWVFWGERPRRSVGRAAGFVRHRYVATVLSSAAEVWSPSRAGVEAYLALGVARAEILPYPLDWPAWFPASARGTHSRGCDSQAQTILVVGSLIPRKRPLMAVALVRELLRRGLSHFELTFIGRGPLRKAVEAEARGLPVHIVDHLNPAAVRAAMRRASVLVHTSEEDGWGMVVPEAVMSGTPVVSVPWCDSAVELSRWTNTVTVVPDSVEALADAVAERLASPSTDRELASAARAAWREVGAANVASRAAGYLRRVAENA